MKRKSPRKLSEVVTCFKHLGKTEDAVVFDRPKMIATFNLDCGFIRALHDQKDSDTLATIAAAHIAHATTGTTEEFSRVFSKMLERHVLQEATR